MPIAAKFSEGFYQKFGHQATEELVEYLNAIETTHRSELERLNEANWLRFEARLDQRMAELRSDMAALKAELLKWMFVFWVGTIGTVIALQRL